MKKDHIWQELRAHHRYITGTRLRDMFAGDDNRATAFTLQINDLLLVDYSKNRITGETMGLLADLAEATGLHDHIDAMFSGEIVNLSEQRPALHTVLRRPSDTPLQVGGIDLNKLVHEESLKVAEFTGRLIDGRLHGSNGQYINTLVNIGIGGSDLGPRLVVDALKEFHTGDTRVEFVANLDPNDIHNILGKLNPQTTMFVVTSKSFTTMETHANAMTARKWLTENGCPEIDNHFIAVSSNIPAAVDFGIKEDNIFSMWDWVGGRYSVWSSVGISIAAAIGMQAFREFLDGAHKMDEHFRTAPFTENLPVILGLLDVWYNNFFGAETLAVVPYDQRLRILPEYLSQLIMESNGKGVTDDGSVVEGQTSSVIWGSVGTNAQHAFFQMLHQGTKLVPVEFLLPLRSRYTDNFHKLVANCLAQSKALMLGSENKAEPHRNFPGNRPSTTIAYNELTPATLGMLLAMYEHRTLVQAKIWGINPFDQWGVELGKTLASAIIKDLESGADPGPDQDASTRQLIELYRSRNKKGV